MGVVRSPNGTTRSGRVLGYKMSREARRKLAQQKAIRERCKEGRAGVVKVGKFSSQIPLSQTTGRDEPQCSGTIRYVSRSERRFLGMTVMCIL